MKTELATTTATINHDEIANLAFTAWQRDGCPQGRDLDYWLEAETQLKATKHLLAVEVPANVTPKRRASKGRAVTAKTR